MSHLARLFTSFVLTAFCAVVPAAAQGLDIVGTVRDQTGDTLPGVLVELTTGAAPARRVQTDERGAYRFDGVAAGRAVVSFSLINFGAVRREIDLTGAGPQRIDVTLQLALSADVTVTGKSTFTNLADVERPAENVVGVAQSASQGAITARQLDARPLMRTGEVLETVPGVVISQHSGEGKANQYYLRGFNLDHGTDFATTVAGLPVNMPTHGHGHGYSDLNFLIPELDQRRPVLEGPVLRRSRRLRHRRRGEHQLREQPGRGRSSRVGGGGQGFGRALAAASPRAGTGTLLGAVEVQHNDGPWDGPDDFRKVNGAAALQRGRRARTASRSPAWATTAGGTPPTRCRSARSTSGRSTGSGPSTPPTAATRIATPAPSSGSGPANNAITKVSAYRPRLRPQPVLQLHLFPRRSRQRRPVPPGRPPLRVAARSVTHRRLGQWGSRPVAERRRPAAPARRHRQRRPLSHGRARSRLETIREDERAADQRRRLRPERDAVDPVAADARRRARRWIPLRRRFRRSGATPAATTPSLVSPKGGMVFGPWQRHRALRQRGLRLPQQRRARRDHHASIPPPASRPSA